MHEDGILIRQAPHAHPFAVCAPSPPIPLWPGCRHGKELRLPEATSGRSPFAQSVLDGLSGKADANADTLVDIKELVQFVRADVKQRTNGDQKTAAAIPSLQPLTPINRRPSMPRAHLACDELFDPVQSRLQFVEAGCE